jgi:transposase
MTNAETITISKQEYDELIRLKSEVAELKFRLSELNRLIFGAKSERFIAVDPQQMSLFEAAAEEKPKKQTEQISYTRTKKEDKKQPLRMELPSHLPRKVEVIEPVNLPENAKKIGETITEVLDYQPADLFVRQIVRPKYIISSTDEKTEIVIAQLPTLPIAKGNAGAGLISQILISKFVDHLPFYRQIQIFKRQNVNLAESTINGWFNAGCRHLEPLFEVLKQKLLSTDYLMADETPISVLTKDKPGSTHKGYHWVYYDPVNKLAVFDYQKTRGREGPDEMLKTFSGHLQTDGYVAYTKLENHENITLLACMAHARRKFEHALNNDYDRATFALKLIQSLYAIEQKARDNEFDYQQIKELRQSESVPLLKQFEQWLKKEIYNILPQSAIGKAISYTLNLWERLESYTKDGRFQIDNNLIENSIRPVALGRKNYLFAGSHEAAQQAAMMYSLLACCKINNIEPFNWLKNTLTQIQNYPANKIHELLPR